MRNIKFENPDIGLALIIMVYGYMLRRPFSIMIYGIKV